MNPIAELLSADDILLECDITSKSRLFDEVGRHLQQRHGLPQAQVVESLNAREDFGSTAVGNGVAIPHARIAGLHQAVAVFIRPKLPMQFDSPDRKPVSDILALLVPEHATEQHLQILAGIAHLFSDRRFREELRCCSKPSDVCRLFSDWPPSRG
jgi:nitrogen PTS system EIIA component